MGHDLVELAAWRLMWRLVSSTQGSTPTFRCAPAASATAERAGSAAEAASDDR